MIDLRLGDCLEVLEEIPAGSVDCVIADMPYGTTNLAWDRPIALPPLWERLSRVIKPDAAIVLFGSQPFTSDLVISNRGWFRYAMAWRKSTCGGVFNARFRPVRNHEDVLVFSPAGAASGCKSPMKYRPQGIKPGTRVRRQAAERDSAFVTSRPSHPPVYSDRNSNYPKSVIEFANHNGAYWGRTGEATSKHPTRKPLALMEYLVRTYSDPGDAVLDFAMGSGSTGVACIAADRDFIGIELDEAYFVVAGDRIASARASAAAAAI